MGTTPVEMYKLFFRSQEMCPDLTEDAGLSCNRPDTQVSSPVPGHAIRTFIINLPFKELSLEQERIAKAKLIRCPAPLPETTPDPVLIKMLEVAPSEEGEGGNRETTTYVKEALSKGGIKKPKAGLTHCSSKPGDLVPPRRRITGEKNLKFLLPKEISPLARRK